MNIEIKYNSVLAKAKYELSHAIRGANYQSELLGMDDVSEKEKDSLNQRLGQFQSQIDLLHRIFGKDLDV